MNKRRETWVAELEAELAAIEKTATPPPGGFDPEKRRSLAEAMAALIEKNVEPDSVRRGIIRRLLEGANRS